MKALVAIAGLAFLLLPVLAAGLAVAFLAMMDLLVQGVLAGVVLFFGYHLVRKDSRDETIDLIFGLGGATLALIGLFVLWMLLGGDAGPWCWKGHNVC